MARGECPACNALNEYTEVCCSMCGQRLPWAQAILNPQAAPASQQYNPTIKLGTTPSQVQSQLVAPAVIGAALPSPVGCLPLFSGFLLATAFAVITGVIAPLVSLLVFVGSVIWVGFDASQIGVKRGQVRGLGDSSVTAWVFGCLLLWGIAFPAYLLARPTLKAINEGQPLPEPLNLATSIGALSGGVMAICISILVVRSNLSPAQAPPIPTTTVATPAPVPTVFPNATIPAPAPAPIAPPQPSISSPGFGGSSSPSASGGSTFTAEEAHYAAVLTKAYDIVDSMKNGGKTMNDMAEAKADAEQAQSLMDTVFAPPRFAKVDSLFRSALEEIILGFQLAELGNNLKDEETMHNAATHLHNGADLLSRSGKAIEEVDKF